MAEASSIDERVEALREQFLVEIILPDTDWNAIALLGLTALALESNPDYSRHSADLSRLWQEAACTLGAQVVTQQIAGEYRQQG